MGNFGTVTLTTKAEFEPWFKDVLKKAKPCDSDYSAIEEHIGSLCKTLKPFMLTTSTPRQELDSKLQAIQQAFNPEKAEGRPRSSLETRSLGQVRGPDQVCGPDKGPKLRTRQCSICLTAQPVTCASRSFSRGIAKQKQIQSQQKAYVRQSKAPTGEKPSR